MRVYAYTYMYDCLVAQPPRRQPLCPFRPRGRQSVAAAAQRPYVLMSLCSSVSRVSGQRTKQQTSNGTACHITTLIALFLSQIYPLTLVHKLIICKFAITCHLCQYIVYSTSRANKGFGEFWKQCAACWIAYTRLHKTIKCHNYDTPNKQSAGQYVWNHTTGAHTRTIYIIEKTIESTL